MSTDIVVGIDGSENSEKAMSWALDEAELRGVRVPADTHLYRLLRPVAQMQYYRYNLPRFAY